MFIPLYFFHPPLLLLIYHSPERSHTMKKILYKLWSKTLGAPVNSVGAQIFLLLFFVLFAWALWTAIVNPAWLLK